MKWVVLFFCFGISYVLCAQQIGWTWMSGDSTRNSFDVYGNKRVFDPLNRPGSISPLISFQGKDGNFYLFGGTTLILLNGFTTVQVPTCALWKYSPLLNQWSMPTGGNGNNPSVSTGGEVLGLEGTFSSLSTPGYLSSMSANWTDSAGNWWLFGGKTGYREFGTKCALWKYDLMLSQWMVVKSCSDDSWASYGVQGIGHISNTPGARQSMLAWKDRKGRFYIFGGYNVTSKIYYADVWMYDPASNQWTWQHGRKGGPGESSPRMHGASGVFAAENTPGISTAGSAVLDSVDLNDVVRLNVFTETWLYSMSLHQWAWISGDRTVSSPPAPTMVRHYGTKGVPSVLNNPGTRSAPATWIDDIYTWIYGGYPVPSTQNELLSDLWKYNRQTTEWTWVSGDSAANLAHNYGVKGIPSPSTTPGGRNSPFTWVDAQGDMWLLGGTVREQSSSNGLTTVRLNDLWKFTVPSDDPLLTKISAFAASPKAGEVSLSWSTVQEHNSKAFNIQRSGDSVQFATIGTVTAAGNSSTLSNYSFTDKSPFAGRSFYRLQLIALDNSTKYSDVLTVSLSPSTFSFQVLSNPLLNTLSITINSTNSVVVGVEVRDVSGRLEMVKRLSVTPGRSIHTLALDRVPSGVHLLRISNGSDVLTKRFVSL